jgi:hypothetical protein
MPGAVAEVRCAVADVVVRTRDLADVEAACDGAEAAITFLTAQGLDVDDPISIDLVQVLPKVVDSSAVGCYLGSEKRVVILEYEKLEHREQWLGLPIDRALYRSLVAHEVAHSIAACNFKLTKPTLQSQEYVAYVTTFATMAPSERKRVLAQYPGHGHADDSRLNAMFYLFDPTRFGVEAYRHFLKPANGRDYLHRVLDGKALAK